MFVKRVFVSCSCNAVGAHHVVIVMGILYIHTTIMHLEMKMNYMNKFLSLAVNNDCMKIISVLVAPFLLGASFLFAQGSISGNAESTFQYLIHKEFRADWKQETKCRRLNE